MSIATIHSTAFKILSLECDTLAEHALLCVIFKAIALRIEHRHSCLVLGGDSNIARNVKVAEASERCKGLPSDIRAEIEKFGAIH